MFAKLQKTQRPVTKPLSSSVKGLQNKKDTGLYNKISICISEVIAKLEKDTTFCS